MRIQNNITAMNTHRMYTINNSSISKSAEKLSSGYRINRAGDDAAGLAISEKMRAQIRGLQMASKNSQDAISLVQTAEGALQESHNILQRMRELSVQSASDTNETSIDRAALQAEFSQLINELDDTASKTKFNDMGLIDGTFAGNVTSATVAGSGTTNPFSGAWAAPAVRDGSFTIKWESKPVQAEVAGTAATAKMTVSSASFTHNAVGVTAVDITFVASTDTESLKDASLNGVWSIGYDTAKSTFTARNSETGEVKTAIGITVTSSAAAEISFGNLGTVKLQSTGGAVNVDQITGFSGKIMVTGGVTPVAAKYQDVASINGEELKLEEGQTKLVFNNAGITLNLAAGYRHSTVDETTGASVGGTDLNGSITVKKLEQQPLVIQTGANQGDELRINIDKMDAQTLGVKNATVGNRLNASAAITMTNKAINIVSTQRAALGALQNRLNHKISNLDNTAENLQAAESRIRDVDIAKEMTNFTKANILSQASTAMLAQANAAPQGVLSLLQ